MDTPKEENEFGNGNEDGEQWALTPIEGKYRSKSQCFLFLELRLDSSDSISKK